MKRITVAYWHSKVALPGIDGNDFEYSDEKRNQIIDVCLENDYNVMLQKIKDKKILIIWIDQGRFRQM